MDAFPALRIGGMDWPDPWCPIRAEHAESFHKEMRRELAEGHPLYGLPMRVIARRADCDDALFLIEDGSDRVAVVHLTWSGRSETPSCPSTELWQSLGEWRAVYGPASNPDAPS